MDLLKKDKVAVVTGGTRGIGKAIALRLASEGAKVMIAATNSERCAKIVAEIQEMGGTVAAMVCDISQRGDVEQLAAETIKRFGKVDILVNNAGITRDGILKRITDDMWESVIDINLKSVFICSQIFSPYMAEQKWGRIINMSSLSGAWGTIGQANYAASKAGIIGFTKTLARELGRKNITVNAIAPGLINTDMAKEIPEQTLKETLAGIPLGRLGEPEEIAAAVSYLASEEAGFVNGITLHINGGAYLV
jgi:3-oxoacyl-[acyl-carrier protein] reductase